MQRSTGCNWNICNIWLMGKAVLHCYASRHDSQLAASAHIQAVSSEVGVCEWDALQGSQRSLPYTQVSARTLLATNVVRVCSTKCSM